MSNMADSQDRFDAEFVRHQRQVYRFVAVLLPERDVAEEVFQQTCYVLLKSRDKFDPGRDFLAWAQGIARNIVKEYLRTRRKAPLELSDTLLDRLAEAQEQLGLALDARLAALGGCLQKLRPKERSLLERCYAGVENIRAIAAELKLAPAVLYKRLDRLRWSLMECVERAVAREDRS